MKIRSIFLYCIVIGVATVSAQPPADESSPRKMTGMPPFDAPGGMHSPAENPSPMMMNISELKNLMTEINIDKNVSMKIITIARTFLKSFNEQILKIQKEELNIKEELLKEKPDMQAIQNAVNRKSTVFGEIEFAQIKRDLEIKSLLTQDEYDLWKSAMMQKMRHEMPRMMEKVPSNPVDKKNSPQKQ